MARSLQDAVAEMQSDTSQEVSDIIQAALQHLQGQVQTLQGQLSSQQQSGAGAGASQSNVVPRSVKVEKPQPFKGAMDGNAVDTFIYTCELYFSLSGVTDENMKAQLAIMWLTDDAAIWFRSLGVNLSSLQWSQLKDAIVKQFKPVDHLRRARDLFAQCKQTGTVQAYISYFRRVLVQVSDASAAEALDRFVRGLKSGIHEQVLVQNPKTWEEAALHAERVGSVKQGGNVTSFGSAKQASSSGVQPMDLGTMDSSSSQQQQSLSYMGGRASQGSQGGKRKQVCFLCRQPGHFRKDCPQNKAKRSKNAQ